MTDTITTTLRSSVTLGTGIYTSPLSITSTGGIAPSTNDGATALLFSNPGTVTNSGVITGDAGFNDSGFNNTNPAGAGGTGVVMSTGSFTNNKQITGGKGGEVSNFLSTASTKDGAGGYGLTLSGGSFTNAGTITGGAGGTGNLQGDDGAGGGALGGTGGYGVLISGGTLINTGTIVGGAGGANYLDGVAGSGKGGQGVTMTGGVFIDAGAIISHGAGFVVSGTNAATVIIESGASFTDDEYSHDSNATLAVGGTTPFVLAAIGTDERFYGFQHLSFASTLSGFGLAGDASGLANGQDIAGMVTGDNITLTGFAATSDSFASANNLVLKNSAGSTETIDLVGFTSTGQLRFANDGSNTTLTASVSTISTAVTNAVTLGAGTYANAVSITNTGAVTGPAGAAGGSAASGTAGSIAVLLNAVSDTLTNSGVVTGGAGGSAPSGSAESGGAGGAGVALSAGLLVNAGNITGGAGGAYGYPGGSTGKSGAGGAGVSTTGQATIINSGNISGGQAGVNTVVINDLPFGSFTHLESSNIGGVGVALSTGSTLMNSGAITGATAATIYSTRRAQAGAAGVSLAGSGQVTNSSSGVITGGTGGGSQNASFQPGGGGNGGTGLVSGASETLLNQGHITGGNGGYAWQSSAGNGGTGLSASSGDVITNTGVITGGNGAKEDRFQGEQNLPGANGAGVYLNGGTLINAGTIAGGTYAGQGNAVSFGATAATLVVENGAVFNGNIVANSAVADVLAFAGSSSTKFSGIGTSAYNFNHISFASGAAWTVEGNAAGLAASGETIAGFTSTDAIILDSFAATSETLVAGKLTLGNGSSFDTLNLGASTDNFVVQSNGTNSTILAAPGTISLATGTYILSGHSIGLTGTSISGFAAGDTIDLEGFSATSETYKSGIGLVLGNGTSFDTLQVNSFAGNFADHTDGTNTTIVAKPLVSIISTHVGAVGGSYSYVTLGNGTYADSLTITSSGVVAHPFGPTDISDTAGQTGITLVNQGVIDNADKGVDFVNAAYVNNSGDIDTDLGISLQNGGTIVNSGQIQGSGFGYSVWLKGGTIINAGYIGGNQAIYSSQALTLIEEVGQSGSSQSTARSGNYNGTVIFAAGTSSQDISQFKGFTNISFATGAAWDITIQPSNNHFNGVSITGFTKTDTIDLENFIVTSHSFANGVLTVNGQNGGYQLDFAGNFTPSNFYFASDGNFGTNLTALCYLRGTKILTPDGEKPIESLNIGDTVVTRFGGYQKIKWIGRQAYDNRFIAKNPGKIPVCISAGALGDNLPARDLFVSPGHSILCGRRLILASSLVNGLSITQDLHLPAPHQAVCDYFQIEIETHDCVCADGTWAETFCDGPGLRNQFHNAAEFWALYPDHITPETLKLCAPRPLAGAELEAALLPLITRATAGITPGTLQGNIDRLTPTRIEGWAMDSTHPDLPVLLQVMLGSRVIATILACDPRPDLAPAGKGNGNHAFALDIIDPLSPAELSRLTIRHATTGTQLPTPMEHVA